MPNASDPSVEFSRSHSPINLLIAILLGFFTVSAFAADQIIPIVGHAIGGYSSTWRSDIKLYNPSSRTIKGVMVFTPKNQSASATDVPVAFTISPRSVQFYPDAYTVAHPGGSGADRVLVKVDTLPADSTPYPAPIVESTTYNLAADGGEYGQMTEIYATDSWYSAGTTLDAVLGKSGERNGLFVLTGSQSVTIEWTYADSSGGNTFKTTKSYGPDMTFQYSNGVTELLGFEPGPSGTLVAKITSGKARVAITLNNNKTNDPRWSELRRRLPEVTYGSAWRMDYGHPENYDEQGNQTALCDASVISSLRGKEPSVAHLGEIWRWITRNFSTWSAGGQTIGKVTTNDLMQSRRLGGCHDWGLVFISLVRELGYPAVMIDAASIPWALAWHPGSTDPYVGHVFVEVFVADKWVLIDSTGGQYVENGYDPGNPVIPLRFTSNDGTTPGTYGLFVMRKGADSWGYGVRSGDDLRLIMDATATEIQSTTLHYPSYAFQRFP